MIGNTRCCNNIHRGNKDLCHCSMDVSWLHDIVPSKIKFNLNCHCQLTCDVWGIPNTKLKYCQCTSAALLCCKNTQLFNCIWQIITHVWWLGIVLCIPSRYKTSFSSQWLFLCIWDFGRSRDQNGPGGSVGTVESVGQLVACNRTHSHNLNKLWLILNWTLTNKLQSNVNKSTQIFIQWNISGNVVCKTSAGLPQSLSLCYVS